MTFESKGVSNALLSWVEWNPKVISLAYFDLRNRQGNTHVRIKCDWKLITVRASYSTFELAMHEVNYYRLVSFQVVLPWIFWILFVVLTFRFYLWDNRFLLNSVKVFMKAIKNEVKKLRRILLFTIVELNVKFKVYNFLKPSYSLLELPRSKEVFIFIPKLL